MDGKIDNHDVYKVETISDSYLVSSGVPRKNGDRYVSNIIICLYYLYFYYPNGIVVIQFSLPVIFYILGTQRKFVTWRWI